MTLDLPDDSVLSARDQLAPASRYELLAKIAAGGMASVYLGRLRAPGGFRPLVAIKRAHAHMLGDPVFARMFLAEARLASRIHHPNVVAVHDVEQIDDELVLVMDYVEGGALSDLLGKVEEPSLDPGVVVRILLDAAAGLGAAHELVDDEGELLRVVHRDISPQNILVGNDGVARIADFGIAKCENLGNATLSQGFKGKLAYMAPEYLRHQSFDARSDVFALGIVAWEALTGKRLFRGANEIATLKLVVGMTPRRPSDVRPGIPREVDDVVLRALEKHPESRWPSARAFAEALRAAATPAGLIATHASVGAEVELRVGEKLHRRRRATPGELPRAEEERSSTRLTQDLPDVSGAYYTHSLAPGVDSTASVFSAPARAQRSPSALERVSRATWLGAFALASLVALGTSGLATTLRAPGGPRGYSAGVAHAAPPSVAAVLPSRLELRAEVEPEPTRTIERVADLPRAAQGKSAVPRIEPKAKPAGRAPRPRTSRDVAAPNPYGPPP